MKISNKNEKLLLLAANFGGNVGDLFICEAVVKYLSKHLPQTEIDICPYPLRNDPIVAFPAMLDMNAQGQVSLKSPITALRKSIDHLMRRHPFLEKWVISNYYSVVSSFIKKTIHQPSIDYKYIVSVGGEMDIPYSLLDIHSYFHNIPKPVNNIVYGPISLKVNDRHISFLKEYFNEVDEVAIRDPRTYRNLKKIGIENIKLIPDCAFLAYEGQDHAEKDSWKGYIGLCLHSRWAHTVKTDDFIQAMARAAQEIDSKIILFVTNIREDHRLIRKLMAISDDTLNIEIALPTNTKSLQTLYQKLDLVISDRLHGILIGMISGCNVLPIATRDKIKGYCEYLELDNFLSGEEDETQIAEKIKQSYLQHEEIRERISVFVSEASETVQKYYKDRLKNN